MENKIIFDPISKSGLKRYIETNKQRKIINFLNLHDIYQYKNNEDFKKSLQLKENINLIDGFFISAYLSLLNRRKIKRTSGPIFTRYFLSSIKSDKNKPHIFIGIDKDKLKEIKSKFKALKNSYCYNPPYIKEQKFSKEEIKKISNIINKNKIEYVWVGIGCPKQNILSSELLNKTKSKYYFNVGAAIDFILDIKKEAPKIVRKIGFEWLYRLLTDFSHTKKKVYRSLIAISHTIGVVGIKRK